MNNIDEYTAALKELTDRENLIIRLVSQDLAEWRVGLMSVVPQEGTLSAWWFYEGFRRARPCFG